MKKETIDWFQGIGNGLHWVLETGDAKICICLNDPDWHIPLHNGGNSRFRGK